VLAKEREAAPTPYHLSRDGRELVVVASTPLMPR
jgi:hypothetical protein